MENNADVKSPCRAAFLTDPLDSSHFHKKTEFKVVSCSPQGLLARNGGSQVCLIPESTSVITVLWSRGGHTAAQGPNPACHLFLQIQFHWRTAMPFQNFIRENTIRNTCPGIKTDHWKIIHVLCRAATWCNCKAEPIFSLTFYQKTFADLSTV